MSIELVMLSNHLILCRLLRLLPSIFPSVRVFSGEKDALCIRWPNFGTGSRSICLIHSFCGVITSVSLQGSPLFCALIPLTLATVGDPRQGDSDAQQGFVGFLGMEAFLSPIPYRYEG